MKLHLPSSLRSALLACMVSFGTLCSTLGTGTFAAGAMAYTLAVTQAEAIEYSGTIYTWEGSGNLSGGPLEKTAYESGTGTFALTGEKASSWSNVQPLVSTISASTVHHTLRFAANSGAGRDINRDFEVLRLGGVIVESGATGFRIVGPSGNKRLVELGNNGEAAYSSLKEDFAINMSGSTNTESYVTLKGTQTWDIAAGKTFTLAAGSNAAVRSAESLNLSIIGGGTAALTGAVEMAVDSVISIAQGAALTLAADGTASLQGRLTNAGTLKLDGTVMLGAAGITNNNVLTLGDSLVFDLRTATAGTVTLVTGSGNKDLTSLNAGSHVKGLAGYSYIFNNDGTVTVQSGESQPMIWGGGSGTWGGQSTPWTQAGAAAAYASGSAVIINGNGGEIALSGQQLSSSVSIEHSGYTLTRGSAADTLRIEGDLTVKESVSTKMTFLPTLGNEGHIVVNRGAMLDLSDIPLSQDMLAEVAAKAVGDGFVKLKGGTGTNFEQSCSFNTNVRVDGGWWLNGRYANSVLTITEGHTFLMTGELNFGNTVQIAVNGGTLEVQGGLAIGHSDGNYPATLSMSSGEIITSAFKPLRDDNTNSINITGGKLTMTGREAFSATGANTRVTISNATLSNGETDMAFNHASTLTNVTISAKAGTAITIGGAGMTTTVNTGLTTNGRVDFLGTMSLRGDAALNINGETSIANLSAASGASLTLSGRGSLALTGAVSLNSLSVQDTTALKLDNANLSVAQDSLLAGISVTGNTTLAAQNGASLTLTQSITNSGVLTLSGTIIADALETKQTGAIISGYLNTDGAVGTSGFYADSVSEGQVVVVSGAGSVNTDAAKVMYRGGLLSVGSNGIATDMVGNIDYSTYYINGDSASLSAILAKSPTAAVQMSGGMLTVDTDCTTEIRHDSASVLEITAQQMGGQSFSGYQTIAFRDIESSSFAAALNNESTIALKENGTVTFSENSILSNGSYGACGLIGNDSSAELSIIDNEEVAFDRNKVSSSSTVFCELEGGVIRNYGLFNLSGNRRVSFSGNSLDAISTSSWTCDAAGCAIENGGTFILNGNGCVTFSGNTAFSARDDCWGGAISNWGTLTLSDNGNVTFSGNTVSSSYASGGAIYNQGTFTLSGNGNVLFEKNAEVRKGTYRLRSIYSTGTLNLSASEGKSILFRDSVYAIGTVNLNTDGTGDIIFTGESTEADLREVKDGVDGTVQEIADSRSSVLDAKVTLGGGTLQVRDAANLTVKNLTAAAGSELVLHDASFTTTGNSTLAAVSISGNSVLAAQEGATLTLTQAITNNGALELSGIINADALEIEYLSTGDTHYINTAGQQANSGFEASTSIAQMALTTGTGTVNADASKVMYRGGLLSVGSNGTATGMVGNIDYSTYYINGDSASLSAILAKSLTAAVQMSGGTLTVDTDCTTEIRHDKSAALTFIARQTRGKEFSGYGNLVFENISSSSDGGAISNWGTLTLSDNGNVTFSGDTVSSSYASGGAIYNDYYATFTLSDNGDVLFEKNAEVRNGTYRLRSIYSGGTLNLSASEGKGILFKDSVYASGRTAAVNLNIDGTGDIIFTGESTEADLREVKGGIDGTAQEIADSRSSVLYATVTLGGGTLQVRDAASLTVRNLTAADASELVLHDASFTTTGDSTLAAVSISGNSVLAAQEGASLTVKNLTASNGSELVLNEASFTTTGDSTLAAVSISGNTSITAQQGATLKLTQAIANNGNLTLSGTLDISGLSYAEGAPGYINTEGESSTSGFACWDDRQIVVVEGSGSLNADSAVVLYKGNTLTLNSRGVAAHSGTVDVDYSTYYINGDSASLSAILAKSPTAAVQMSGGTLTVDTNCTTEIRHDNTSALEFTARQMGGQSFSGYGDVTFSGNRASYDGSAISNYSIFTLSGNGDVTFSGNSASSRGGAIYNYYYATFTLSGNGDVTFSGNRASYDGSAISNYSTFTLSGNGDVLFEKNYEKSNGTYRLRSIYSGDATLNLSAPEGKSILFKDSVYASGRTAAVNLNIDGTGDIIFTGESTEADLREVKGGIDGTAQEIADSRSSVLYATVTLGGGTLQVRDAASLTVRALTAAAGSELVLHDASFTTTGDSTLAAVTVTGNSVLAAQEGTSLTVKNLTASNGSELVLNEASFTTTGDSTLAAVSISGNTSITAQQGATLKLTQAIANNGTLTLSGTLDVSGLTMSEEASSYINTQGECSTSGFASWDACQIVVVERSGSLNADSAVVLYKGNTLTLNSRGVAAHDVDYSTYYINGDSASLSAILAKSPTAAVQMSGGTLTVDTNCTTEIRHDNTSALEFTARQRGGQSFSGYGDVTFIGNMVFSSGGAIYNSSTFTLSGNGDVSFSGNMATQKGGAIYHSGSKGGSFTIAGNGDVLFEKNAEIEMSNASYRLRSIYSTGTLNLSASEAKIILFRDSVYASGTVNLNQDGTGDIIFTGATTEADLREVKGGIDGTAQEIADSRSSALDAMVTLGGGTLQVRDAASLTVKNLTAAAGSELVLHDASFTTTGNTTLAAVTITGNSSLTAQDGATLTLTQSITNNGALTLSGTFNADAFDVKIVEAIDYINAEGESGRSGFLHTYGSCQLNLTEGTGTLNADAAIVRYQGIDLTWTLGGNNVATWEAAGEIDYSIYYVNEERASLSSICAKSPTAGVLMNGGVLELNNLRGSYANKIEGSGAVLINGSSMVMLAGQNSYSGGTRVEAGTLVAGNVQALGTGAVELAGGTLDLGSYVLNNELHVTGEAALNNANRYTGKLVLDGGALSGTTLQLNQEAELLSGSIANNMTGKGGVVKNGSGTAVLSGMNTYDGTTIVNEGTLQVSGLVTSNIELNGGTLDTARGMTLAYGQQVTLAGGSVTGNLQTSDGSSLLVQTGTTISGNLTLNGGDITFINKGSDEVLDISGTLAVNPSQMKLVGYDSAGQYVLAHCGALTGSLGNFDLTTTFPEGSRQQAVLTNAANYLILSVTGDATTLNWAGGSGTWAKGNGTKWTGPTDTKFYSYDTVVFEKGGTVSISGEVMPREMLVGGSTAVTLRGTGRITGDATLTKTGSCTLTMNATNTYTGGTEIEEGVVKAGGAASFGENRVVLHGGELNLNAEAVTNEVYATGGTISGGSAYAGTLTVEGAVALCGTLTAESVEMKSGSLTGGELTDTALYSHGGTLAASLTGKSEWTVEGDVVLAGYAAPEWGTYITAGSLTVADGGELDGDVVLTGGTLVSDLHTVHEGRLLELSGGAVIGSVVVEQDGLFTMYAESGISGDLSLESGALFENNGNALTIGGTLSVAKDSSAVLSGVVKAGSVSLQQGATVELMEGNALLSVAEGAEKLTFSGIELTEAGMRGSAETPALLDNALLKLAEGTSFTVENMVLGAHTRITDDPAALELNNATVMLAAGVNVAPVGTETLEEAVLVQCGGQQMLTTPAGSTVMLLEASTFDSVTLTGNTLALKLSGIDQSELQSYTYVGVSFINGGDYARFDSDLVVTLTVTDACGHQTLTGWYRADEQAAGGISQVLFETAMMPEPATATLSLLALAALAARRRRR